MPVTIVGVGPAGHRGTINIGVVTDFWLPIASLPALGAPPRALDAASRRGGVLREGAAARRRHRGAGAGRDGILGRGWPRSTRRRIRARASACSRRATCASIRRWTPADAPSRRCCSASSAWCWRSPAATWRRCCSCAATARAKEVSVRLALGATRWQLVRHLLTESLLLSLAGGVAGCVLAWWAIRSLGAVDLPIVVDLSLDYRVLAFALVALARHRRGLRPGAGAQGHAGRSGADAARRRRDAVGGASLAHAQERARRVPGGGVGRAAGRHQPLPADGERGAGAAARLRGRRRGDARDRCALRRLHATRGRQRCSRSCAAGSPRLPACRRRVADARTADARTGVAVVVEGADGAGPAPASPAPAASGPDPASSTSLRIPDPVRPRDRRARSRGRRRSSP